jgi:cysteine desulfurase
MQLQKYFVERINNEIPEAKINGSLENRIWNNLNYSFNGINGEDLLIKLDELGLEVSTGSACSSKRKKKASHVLESIGLSYDEISSSIRFSLGIQNSIEEINTATDILKRAILEIKNSK